MQITYDDLFRNNEEHIGKTVSYLGKIIQVIEGGGNEYQLRVNVTKGEYSWDDTVLLRYEGSRLLEDDIIEFVARVNGLVTYEAIMGNEITIPDLTSIATEIAQDPDGSPPSASSGIAVYTPTPPAVSPTQTPAPMATVASQATSAAAPTTTPSATPAPLIGERENPIPVNHMATFPTWELSVLSFDGDATSAIEEENQFNSAPAPGHVYVMVQVQGTYTGTDFGSMWLDLNYYLAGDTNVIYEEASVVAPGELNNQPDTLPGGTVAGNLAFMVPEDTLNSLVMLISDGGLRYADTIAYFSLPDPAGAVRATSTPQATGAAPQPTTGPTPAPQPTSAPTPTPRTAPAPTSRADPTSTSTPTSVPTPIPPTAPQSGERGNPIPLNDVAIYPVWEVSVLSFERDATTAIAEENQFNDPPAPGHVYVMVQVQGTYIGTEFGSMWLDLDYYLVGNTDIAYEQVWVVTPDSLTDQPNILPGGTAVGNLAFMVPEGTVDSLAMLISDGGLRYADTIAYFSLGNPTAAPRPARTPAPTRAAQQGTTSQTGERDTPFPFNAVAFYPTWEVSVLSFESDAATAIAEENQFNDPPAPGHVYVMVQVQGTYAGTDFGSLWLDLDFYLVGDTDVVYEQVWVVTPNSLSDQPDALSGGIVDGNLAFMVPEDTVDSLVMLVTDGGLSFADTLE